MRVIQFFTVILAFSIILHAEDKGLTFTISTEVERSSVVDLPRNFVRTYISDLSIYPRFFPGITGTEKLNNKESEWHYTVDAPLAPAINLTFLLESKQSTPSLMVLESINPEADYLYCKAVFDSLNASSTKVTFSFKFRMTRDKASDIHFLAGIFGEDFINARMKDKLDSDMETFIEKAKEDMYYKYQVSH